MNQDGLCKGFFPFIFLFIFQSEEKRITTISGTNDRVGDMFLGLLGARDIVLCARGNILGKMALPLNAQTLCMTG